MPGASSTPGVVPSQFPSATPVGVPTNPFQQPIQPEKKTFPAWAIALIVLGVVGLLVTCCIAATVFVISSDEFQEGWEQGIEAALEELEAEGQGGSQGSAPSGDIDSAALAVIAGEYEVILSYRSNFNGSFDRTEFGGAGEYYIFNTDGTFYHLWEESERDWPLYQGTFSAELFDVNDLERFDREVMHGIDERADVDLWHITLYLDDSFRRGFDIFFSRASDDDIVMYVPDLGETLIVIQAR